MKVICDRGTLVDLLNIVSGVTATRTPKPALSCVKVSAEDGLLTLSATDTELSLRVSTAKVEVSAPGEAAIPADKFGQIVRESIDATVTLEVEQEEAHITGQDAKFKIYGVPVSDFPPVPQFKGDADFQINGADLHRMIRQTIFATARENSRYAFNGVLLERDGNKLVMVATDGRRLALAKDSCKATEGAGKHAAIVPSKALNMVMRLFDNPDEVVKVKITDNQILFASSDAMLASSLVEGNFPPYKDVVPKDGDKKVTIDTDSFASAVRRAALLTNEESKGVRLAFSAEGLTLSSRAPEMGEAEIRLALPSYEGEPIEIGFNPQFILDALKVAGSEQVSGEFKASNKPGIFRSGPDFLYVIMPVNLQ